jgi:hypothetical protein
MTELTFTPEELAILKSTGEAVVITAVKGRWVTIELTGGVSKNVGRADLAPVPPKAVESTKDESAPGAYTGPMLALRDRAKLGVYQKAANGQPSCGDEVAQILGALQPAQVIRACIIALGLDGNPYLHLNVGQQSMNLRNKLRGALIRGEFGMGVVREAAEEVVEPAPKGNTDNLQDSFAFLPCD